MCVGSDVLLKSKAFLKAASGKALDSAIAYCETARMASFSRPLVKDWRIDVRHLLEDVLDKVAQIGRNLVIPGGLLEDQIEHHELSFIGLDLGACFLGR